MLKRASTSRSHANTSSTASSSTSASRTSTTIGMPMICSTRQIPCIVAVIYAFLAATIADCSDSWKAMLVSVAPETNWMFGFSCVWSTSCSR